jgi:hypothetical protein
VRAIETDLRNLGLRIVDETEVCLAITIGIPMGNKPRNFQSLRRFSEGSAEQQASPGDCRETSPVFVNHLFLEFRLLINNNPKRKRGKPQKPAIPR